MLLKNVLNINKNIRIYSIFQQGQKLIKFLIILMRCSNLINKIFRIIHSNNNYNNYNHQ